MKNFLKLLTLLIAFTAVCFPLSCSAPQPDLKALIVTGQNNHNWQHSHGFLKDILEKSEIFSVDVAISPEEGEDMSNFIVDFTPYDVVVLDYNGECWPSQTQTNFVDYVYNGGGVVVYHAANNSFPDWPEYNLITGLGGWYGRDEHSGPYIYIRDGEVVRDTSPGRGGSHGPQHEFIVEAFQPDHPILRGLPEKWKQGTDELYAELRGPAENLEVLAYSYSSKSYGGTGRNEPVLMTIRYGEGRVFHTVLGHAGGGRVFPAMESSGFIVTLQRGAEWAANGEVTQPLPGNFSTEQEVVYWPFFMDIDGDLTPFINRIREYEIGKSNEAFNILRTRIQEDFENQDKMIEYHSILRDLLQSDRTTLDAKRILLRDFSWMANESYRPVYKQLLENPDLAEDARYALAMMDI